jgi:hypothetical protein
VFDFAADAFKEVTGVRNITGGDDIISDDMRFLASEDEDEFAEVSKAAPPVDAQNSDNHAVDVKGQEVEDIRRYPLRNSTQTPAWNLAARATQNPDSPTISSALASTNKDKRLEVIDKEVSALEDADTWTNGSTPAWYEHLALTSGPESKTRHSRCDNQVQGSPCCWRRCSTTWTRL